jgi:hypothetical protein
MPARVDVRHVPIAFAFLQPTVVASDGIEFLLGCKLSVYDPTRSAYHL